MSATWSIGPSSYNPFINTSNSQYGAWTGSSGYASEPPSSSALARKMGGPFIPKPPAPRVSEVTAKDVAKIVSAVDPHGMGTKDKFSDFMSKYASTKMPSQYERALAMHERSVPARRQLHMPLTSSEYSSTPQGKELHNEIITASHAQNGLGSYTPCQRTNWSSKDEISGDYGLLHSSTSTGSEKDFRSKYPTEPESFSMKRTDQNNNMLHSVGYKSESHSTLSRPGLNRSNTFSGSISSQTSTNSRYADTRVALDKLFNSDKRDLLKIAESRYKPTEYKPYGDTVGTNLPTESENYLGKTTNGFSPHEMDYTRDYLVSRDIGRDTSVGSRDYTRDSKSSMYWLYGTRGRPTPDEATTNRSITPYRPGDYMLTSDPEYKQHATSALKNLTTDYNSHTEDVAAYKPYAERSQFEPSRPATPYSSSRYLDDTYITESSYETDIKAPELLSRPSILQRSILKKGHSAPPVTSIYGGYEPPTYRSTQQIIKQLPPLTSGTHNRSSGKKVTFNLSMNQFRAFMAD